MHLRRDIPVAVKSFEIIEIYGLLRDYGTRKCKVYKLVIDILKSTLLCGEDVCLTTGIYKLQHCSLLSDVHQYYKKQFSIVQHYLIFLPYNKFIVSWRAGQS